MFGKDETVFALFKAYRIICIMIMYHGERNKTQRMEGNWMILGAIW